MWKWFHGGPLGQPPCVSSLLVHPAFYSLSASIHLSTQSDKPLCQHCRQLPMTTVRYAHISAGKLGCEGHEHQGHMSGWCCAEIHRVHWGSGFRASCFMTVLYSGFDALWSCSLVSSIFLFFFPAPWNIFLLNIQRDLVCRYLWNILSVFVILFFPFLVFSDCVSQFCLHSPKFWCYVCVCPTEGAQQWCEQSQQSTVCTAFQAHTAADCFWAKLQWYLPVPSD